MEDLIATLLRALTPQVAPGMPPSAPAPRVSPPVMVRQNGAPGGFQPLPNPSAPAPPAMSVRPPMPPPAGPATTQGWDTTVQYGPGAAGPVEQINTPQTVAAGGGARPFAPPMRLGGPVPPEVAARSAPAPAAGLGRDLMSSLSNVAAANAVGDSPNMPPARSPAPAAPPMRAPAGPATSAAAAPASGITGADVQSFLRNMAAGASGDPSQSPLTAFMTGMGGTMKGKHAETLASEKKAADTEEKTFERGLKTSEERRAQAKERREARAAQVTNAKLVAETMKTLNPALTIDQRIQLERMATDYGINLLKTGGVDEKDVKAKMEEFLRDRQAAIIGGAGTPAGGAPATGGGGLPRVNSPEEAMKLPPGTRFLTPDGREKIR